MGKFIIKNAKNGLKFDLKASNGQVIASSQVYKHKKTCLNGTASVMKNAPEAALEDQTVEGYVRQKCPKFEVYMDKKGEYRFRLKATNGQIIAISEGYVKMASCMNGIDSVRKNAVDAPVEEAEEE